MNDATQRRRLPVSAVPVGARVDLWFLDIDVDARPGDLDVLDEAELARASSFAVDVLRRRFIARRIGLRRVLALYSGVDPGVLQFDETCEHCGSQHGRPRLAPEILAASFNASSAEGVGVVAIGPPGRLGVDIERRDAPLHPRLAERILSAAERADLATRPAAPLTVLRLWAAKEAFAKALGLGLTLPMQEISVQAAASSVDCRSVGGTWSVTTFDYGAIHGAVVLEGGKAPVLRWRADPRVTAPAH